ncbi:MAG: dienelactone hydrolase family protein [Chloroflexota bacterium]
MAQAEGSTIPPPRARRVRTSTRRFMVAIVLVLTLAGMVRQSVSVGIKTLALLPEAFENAPVRPLLVFTAPPSHREITWQSPAGRVDADLYLPAGPGPFGGIVLFTGAFGLRRAENMVRFAEGLARSGAAVLVPESEALQRGDIVPDEVDTLIQSLQALQAEPSVDAQRMGLAGFSVGGSLVLLAVEDPRGAELAQFANVLGAFFDAREMLISIASREIVVDSVAVPWTPDAVTRYTFVKHLILSMTEGLEKRTLAEAYLSVPPLGLPDGAVLSQEGRVVVGLIEGGSREQVTELVRELHPSALEWLAAISPSERVDQIRTKLYVMHDRGDVFVPFTEARRLVAGAAPEVLQRFTESALFAHVTIDEHLPPTQIAGELWKLYIHLWALGLEFL